MLDFFSTKWSDSFGRFFVYGKEQESKKYQKIHLPKGV